MTLTTYVDIIAYTAFGGIMVLKNQYMKIFYYIVITRMNKINVTEQNVVRQITNIHGVFKMLFVKLNLEENRLKKKL